MKKGRKIIVFSIIFILFMTFVSIIVVYKLVNRYSTDEIKVIESEIPIKSEKIHLILENLKFNDQPFILPYSVNELTNEFSIEKKITGRLDYDVDGMLLYNGEYAALIQNIPTEDSYIYSLYLSSEYRYAYKFTISGVGIGSSKEELLQTFTNFDKEGDVELDGENGEFFMYIDETTLEFVIFYCLDGEIITIIIGEY